MTLKLPYTVWFRHLCFFFWSHFTFIKKFAAFFRIFYKNSVKLFTMYISHTMYIIWNISYQVLSTNFRCDIFVCHFKKFIIIFVIFFLFCSLTSWLIYLNCVVTLFTSHFSLVKIVLAFIVSVCIHLFCHKKQFKR